MGPMRSPARLALPCLAVALAGAAAVTALTGIWDPDFFHHLAVGRAIARGTSFTPDPFLEPAGVATGVPLYWLGSLALYLASLPAGPAGAVVLVALTSAALFTILLLDATDGRREPHRLLVAGAALALALPELRVRSAPRPEAFAFVLVAFTLLAARRFELGRPRLLLVFPAVALLWNQLHPSVAMGLGVVALLVASEAYRALAGRLRPRGPEAAPATSGVRLPAALLAAGAVATAVTPSPTGPLAVAWRFLLSTLDLGGTRTDGGVGEAVDVLRRHIQELQPLTLADWATRPFGWLVGLALVSFALHRSRGWVRELATVLAFAAFAATALRFAAFAAYVAAPIAARNVAAWLDGVRERQPRLAPAGAAAAACLAAALTAGSPLVPPSGASRTGVGVVAWTLPVRAAAYLRELRFDGRLYNDFGSGGYLEWTLDRPVYQDGRGLISREDVADALPEPVDPPRMARLDARHHFDALVTSAQRPAGADGALVWRLLAGRDRLADRGTWALVAFDDRASVYLRRDGRFGGAAARDEYRLVAPGAPLAPEVRDDPRLLAEATEELGRAAREAPSCAVCRVDLAQALLRAGRLDEAAARLAELRALDVPRWRTQVEVVAAALAERRGDAAEAEARYRAAIRLAVEPAPLRRTLASWLMAAGRARDAAPLVEANLRAGRDPADLGLAVALARAGGDHSGAAALEAELRAAERRARARARTEDGVVLVSQGRRDEALAAFSDALRADDRHAPARTHLGLLLVSMGEDAAALAELSRAVELDPALPEAWFGLGLARERRGDRAGAEAGFRRCVSLRPNGPWAVPASERLAAREKAP